MIVKRYTDKVGLFNVFSFGLSSLTELRNNGRDTAEHHVPANSNTPTPPLGARASSPPPPVCHSPHWFPSRPRRPWERGPPAHTRRCVTPPQMNVVHALTTTPDPRSRSVRNYPLFSLLSICVRPCTPPQAGGTEGITACSVHRSNPPQAGELGGKQDCGAHDAHRRTGAGAGPPGSMPARGHSHQRRCRSGASTRRPQPVSGTSACLA